MSRIQQTIEEIRAELPAGVRLVAVSKYHPEEAIEEAYAVGQRVFGESHAQELMRKYGALPKDIEWHFIGHLQTNKVKYIVPYVSLIHAVDSVKLLREINKQAVKCRRIIRCLLQLHVAREETKFGFTPEECYTMLQEGEWRSLQNIRICGIMCMASNVDDEATIRNEFEMAKDFYQRAKTDFFTDATDFTECSWGMSDDYPIAIATGSNLIRVGSRIFGQRQY